MRNGLLELVMRGNAEAQGQAQATNLQKDLDQKRSRGKVTFNADGTVSAANLPIEAMMGIEKAAVTQAYTGPKQAVDTRLAYEEGKEEGLRAVSSIDDVRAELERFGIRSKGTAAPTDMDSFSEVYRGSRELGGTPFSALLDGTRAKFGRKLTPDEAARQVNNARAMEDIAMYGKLVQPFVNEQQQNVRAEQQAKKDDARFTDASTKSDYKMFTDWKKGPLDEIETEEDLHAEFTTAGFTPSDARWKEAVRYWTDKRDKALSAKKKEASLEETRELQRRRTEKLLEKAASGGGGKPAKGKTLAMSAPVESVLRAREKGDYSEDSVAVAADYSINRLGSAIDKRNATIQTNNAAINSYLQAKTPKQKSKLLATYQRAKEDNLRLSRQNDRDMALLSKVRGDAGVIRYDNNGNRIP